MTQPLGSIYDKQIGKKASTHICERKGNNNGRCVCVCVCETHTHYRMLWPAAPWRSTMVERCGPAGGGPDHQL
jgi:hypothetical protein